MLQIFRKLWHNNTTNPSECLEKNGHMHPTEGSRDACQTQGEEAMQHKPTFVFSVWCILLGHCSSVLESSYFSL